MKAVKLKEYIRNTIVYAITDELRLEVDEDLQGDMVVINDAIDEMHGNLESAMAHNAELLKTLDNLYTNLDEANAEVFRLRNEVEDLKSAMPVENHGQEYVLKE